MLLHAALAAPTIEVILSEKKLYYRTQIVATSLVAIAIPVQFFLSRERMTITSEPFNTIKDFAPPVTLCKPSVVSRSSSENVTC